jgi:beta-galactosidase
LKRGFDIVLRPGPYVCAEHEYGGLPWWLLANGTENIMPRTSEENYMIHVRRWLKVLLPKFKPYLYKNGGPGILTVQIENEYGLFYACDNNYMIELRDIFRALLGKNVVFFTTDGNNKEYLKCGTVEGAYPTIDFGVDAGVKNAFDNQRAYAPQGPLINSEFYPGWLDHWGENHNKIKTERIISRFHEIMAMKANVNFYMFIGGNNFGFQNGANLPYLIQLNTYDYDAPLNEAGDVTDKYMAIRQAVGQYLPLPNMPVPANSSKKAYGEVKMTHYVPLVDVILETTDTCVKSLNPKSFERYGQGYGFILYMKKLDNLDMHGKNLSIPKLHDRAFIQIGSVNII